MTDYALAIHEASHAVAAFNFGLPVTYVSVRPNEDNDGRARFDTHSEALQKLDDFSCAIIKVSGEVGARMHAGAISTDVLFNWFNEGGDAEDARHFIARVDGDELGNRHWATLRAYALLRSRWPAVEELAAKLQKDTTVLGEEVSKVCLAEAARRSARSRAANPPKPRPDRQAKKKARRPSSGDREVRPFTFQVVKSKEG